MVTPLESKEQLRLLSDDGADTVRWMLQRTSGQWESRRLQLLDTVPGVVAIYSEGSAALAVDLYDDSRVGVSGRFGAAPVILDRTVKIRRGVAWAAEPLSINDSETAASRMDLLLRSEMTRPYRDTIITNRQQDPQSAGWTRIASGKSCGFCKALASRGAVFKESTVHFAAHDGCHCTAAPVFEGGETGPEADAMQYMASGRRRTPREKALINDWASQFE